MRHPISAYVCIYDFCKKKLLCILQFCSGKGTDAAQAHTKLSCLWSRCGETKVSSVVLILEISMWKVLDLVADQYRKKLISVKQYRSVSSHYIAKELNIHHKTVSPMREKLHVWVRYELVQKKVPQKRHRVGLFVS